MKKLPVKELTEANFKKYGSFARVINTDARPLGVGDVMFHPDLLKMYANGPIGFSVNLLKPRDFVITALECHDYTQELIMPLDGDVLVHFAPATSKKNIPMDEVEVFRVPKGTALLINTGVWHHAPFPVEGKDMNALVVLAERTYENDCYFYALKEDELIGIDC